MRTRAAGWWIVGSLGLGVVLATTTGCAAENTEGDTPSVDVNVTTETRIFGGEGDNDGAGTSSVVALKIARGDGFELCSGALVAPNIVLTARHCVTSSVTTTVSCDENGHSTNGKHVGPNLPPNDVTLYTGASPKFGQQPVAVASAFVAPSGDALCDTDIALVVLDRVVPNATPLPLRLSGNAIPGETVRSVGYGQNDKAMPIGTRLRRDGVAILAMGAGISKSQTALGAHEFEVGESICEGDSGGPAISETTGAVVGVVSRGGRCDDQAGHIYTTTSGWSQLFADAFAIAGGEPVLETGTPTSPTVPTAEAPARAPASNGGCAAAPTEAPLGAAPSVAVALAALLGLRRARPAKAEARQRSAR